MATDMSALAFLGTNKVGVVNKEIPSAGPCDVVVRTTTSMICPTDVHTVSGVFAIPEGRTLGHESVGVVHEIGDQVTGFREGDRVAVCAITPCGKCDYCQRGHSAQCNGMLGGYKFTAQKEGALAEYFHVSDADFNLVHVPDALSDEQALYASDVLTTGLAGAEAAQVPPGGTLVIVGQGAVGLCATLSARLLGAGLVITVATKADRARMSEKFGADVVLDPRHGDPVDQVKDIVGRDGVDAAIEAVGSRSTFETCVRVTNAMGTIVNLGYHGEGTTAPLTVPVIPFGLGMSDKTIRAVLCPGGRERMLRLFRLLRNGRVDPTPMTTHRFGFDDVERAYKMMSNKSDGIIKPLVTYAW
ncbi:Threonine dehydrogenase [Actinopolyspora xinjiangensis]|uniref:Threonine dehydrogenase n=1 Tax=Actinopolyspora xinjiangensis TaxID=405564 RepID=A0A1H0QN70_9ACTN|nr:alcohol dehydrogenase catalytic domain-containing protein [Actinopolyspora xinjiangensis]SDP18199.1 Threonine dehydrogenase [Actinopolyspora xinjiangensis]